ncbi:HAD family hydrolase [Rhizosaccharibacter radicis]|uniref:Cof-type HAD-IIB family hydrolase n=1 Tax=Rhizosaccharibacter radicis TaxID=2782605 RepID=A0ABT1VX57_9PROT|nr:Cof-type HAD-IIB family hydrolase [Acetobacteraceae bacterium KSS12]
MSLPPGRRTPAQRIRLLVSDIDGTLLTPDKRLTDQTIAAAGRLRAAGVKLCLVSSRPARGMHQFLQPLGIDTPRAGLNGGEIVSPDHRVLATRAMERESLRIVLDMLQEHHVHCWLFAGQDWFIQAGPEPYVPKERRAIGYDPVVVSNLRDVTGAVGKLTGSSNDYALLERMEIELGALIGDRVSARRSADYYLDVTHPDANKGQALLDLAAMLRVPADEVACIGDMSNDVPMLRQAGLGIAMGNASDAVAAEAHLVSEANDREGWAFAVNEFILPRAPGHEADELRAGP